MEYFNEFAEVDSGDKYLWFALTQQINLAGIKNANFCLLFVEYRYFSKCVDLLHYVIAQQRAYFLIY